MNSRAGTGSYSISVHDRMLENDADCKASAGKVWVEHVIPAIDVININVVSVVPAHRPRFNESKPIAAVLETRISADKNWIAHVELVLPTKVGMETLVGNSTVTPGAETELRLRALRGHRLLCALRVLRICCLLPLLPRRLRVLLSCGVLLLSLWVLLILLPVRLLLLLRLNLLLSLWSLSLLLMFRLGLLLSLRSLSLLLMFGLALVAAVLQAQPFLLASPAVRQLERSIQEAETPRIHQ